MARVHPGNSERKFAARNARSGRIDLARAKVPFKDHLLRAEIDKANRIVVIIGDEGTPSIRAHGHAGGLWRDVSAKARLVSKRDLARFYEGRAAPREQV